MTLPIDKVSLRWSLALIALAIVPLLYPAVPPLTDLPGHMARFMVQMDGGRSADIARWYSFHWDLLPNLGADLIAWLLEPLIGLEPTMKAIAILIVSIQVAGYLLLSRAAHGAVAPTALFAIPLALGYPFQFGFLNFTLGAALATLALALWITPAMAAHPARRWAVFCLIAPVVWVCHLAAWAILCILVGCCELAARYARSGRLLPSLGGGFLASSCLLWPQVARMIWPSASGHLPTDLWFAMPLKVHHAVNMLADRWMFWDCAGAILLCLAVVYLWRSGRFTLHAGLALGALALLALYLVMPGTIYGSAYADMRLVPTLMALALICARPGQRLGAGGRRALTAVAVAFVLLRLAGNTVSMALWDRQIREQQGVLDSLPRGSQLVTLLAEPCSSLSYKVRIRDTHMASYALIRRHAFANDQWAMAGGQLLRIDNPAAAPFVDADGVGALEISPCETGEPFLDVVGRIPRTTPYLWMVWHVPDFALPGWRPVARSGGSVLYRRAPGP